MVRLTKDQIGRLGELIAAKDLSRPVMGRFRRPLFRAVSLGDKYPTVDFLVDVLGRREVALRFFFVQVKGTATASTRGTRLPVDVARDCFNLLVRLPAPTYLIGMDVLAEVSYLVAARRPRRTPVSSLTKALCLQDDAVRIALYREVLAFWRANKPILGQTRFEDV
jgi:hypothetical protein